MPAPKCFTANVLNMTLAITSGLFIFLGTVALTPASIFGKNAAFINRYYGARTLHAYKSTTAATLPSQWSSLGSTYAFVEGDGSVPTWNIPAMYKISSGYEPEREINTAKNCATKGYKDANGVSHDFSNHGFAMPLRCLLETSRLVQSVLYVNGASLSILSLISPAVYLSTLMVIYQLSLVYFIFGIIFNKSQTRMLKHKATGRRGWHSHVDESNDKLKNTVRMARTCCCYFFLAWYGGWLATVLLEPTTQNEDWGKTGSIQTVQYHLNSGIASVIYCVIVLVVYYRRSSREYPYWEFLFAVKDKSVAVAVADNSQADTNVNSYTVYNDERQDGTQQDDNESDNVPLVPKTGDESYFHKLKYESHFNPQYTQYTQYNQYAAAHGSFNPIMTHSMNAPLKMPVQTELRVMKQGGLFMDGALRVTKNLADKKEDLLLISQKGLEHLGPVSNETSIIVSLTVFLGGIANLGMTRGVLLETEAQFVIICLFSFLLLEFGRTHLTSYFWYLHEHVFKKMHDHETFTPIEAIRCILIFVDVVVFLLQVMIVTMWQLTMNTLLLRYSDLLRYALLAISSLYLFVRAISAVCGIVELCYILWNTPYVPVEMEKPRVNETRNAQTPYVPVEPKPAEPKPARVNETRYEKIARNLGWRAEKWLYLITVWSTILTILIMSSPTNISKMPAAVRLRFAEKIVHKTSSRATENAKCALGVQKSTLLSSSILMEACEAKDVLDDNGSVDPVDMKVFFWSRGWQFTNSPVIMSKEDDCSKRNCQGSSLLFCSGGFEQHWGQCQMSYNDLHQMYFPRETWKAQILGSIVKEQPVPPDPALSS